MKTPRTTTLFLLCLAAGCTCGQPGSGSKQKTAAHSVTPKRSSLEGVVKDRQGEAIPDVLVLAWPAARKNQSLAQSRSDGKGHFTLSGLAPGKWTLFLEAPGLGTMEVAQQVPEKAPVTVAFNGVAKTITGVVVDRRNQPQAGALISLGGVGLRWYRETRSDASGIFEFRGLGSGKFSLRATLDTAASPSQSVMIEESTLHAVHTRLILAPGGYVRGMVVDDLGTPLPGARVEVLRVPADDLSFKTNSDPSGHFSLGPFAPGRYQLLAQLEDYVLVDAPEVSVSPASASANHRMKLARAAKVHGRLVDGAGRPLPGLAVSILSLIAGKDEVTVIPGPLPSAAEAAAMPAGQLMRPGGVRSAESDAQGEFMVTGLAPGRARLQSQPQDRLPLFQEPLLLVPGEMHEMGDLVIHEGVLLGGQVEAPGMDSLDAIVIEARRLARGSREVLRVTTDPKGHFSLRVPVGRYAFTARSTRFRTPIATEVAAVGGKPVDDLKLYLTAPILPSRH